jgi:ribosome-associated protein
MSQIEIQKYTLGDRDYSKEELAILAVAIANEKKCVRPTILDLRNLSGAFSELFTIVSASNSRQVYAAAEDIRMFFKNNFGLLPVGIDGLDSCTWVLLDYGFMFVHVFQESTRELYQLEQLWNKARSIPVSEEIFAPLYNEALEILKSEQSQSSENSFESATLS